MVIRLKTQLNNKTLLLLAVLAVAAIAIVAFLAFQQPAEKPVIKAAYLPAVQSLPLFTAIEEGMFEKEGLQVEVERIESPNQIIDALVVGKVDAGAPSVAAGITAIVETKNPGALKIYSFTCGTLDNLNDELLVAKDSNIASIADLKGKKIGHIPGVQFRTMTKKILLENDVQPSDVTLVELPIPNQLPTLAAGGVDAVLTLEPTGTIGVKQGISRMLVANPMVRFVADPWCGGAGVVSGKFLKEHPEEARVFVKVMREAIEETKKNPATRQYLVKYLNLPESVAQEVPFPVFVSTKNLDPTIIQAYQQFADVFFELKTIDKKPDVRPLLMN